MVCCSFLWLAFCFGFACFTLLGLGCVACFAVFVLCVVILLVGSGGGFLVILVLAGNMFLGLLG